MESTRERVLVKSPFVSGQTVVDEATGIFYGRMLDEDNWALYRTEDVSEDWFVIVSDTRVMRLTEDPNSIAFDDPPF